MCNGNVVPHSLDTADASSFVMSQSCALGRDERMDGGMDGRMDGEIGKERKDRQKERKKEGSFHKQLGWLHPHYYEDF